jgi:site-specific recombinase
MLDQCREQVSRLRRKGAGAAGSSVSVAHLLERLEQTLGRIEQIMSILTTTETIEVERKSLALWQSLIVSAIDKNSLYALMRNSLAMLSRSITENKSDHGEHYISRGKSSFYALFRSAAGAGFIIALMALLKISIVNMGFSPLKETVLTSLNYGLGFVLIHLLHFTIATKQPAMTAASFASEVEQGLSGQPFGAIFQQPFCWRQ